MNHDESAAEMHSVTSADAEDTEGDTPSTEPTSASEDRPTPEGVRFLTETERAYLRDGTLNGTTEPDILGGLREHFAETLWQTPCIEGLDREGIELLARRLDIPSEEVSALRPNELFDRLDELAVDIGTPIDLVRRKRACFEQKAGFVPD